MIGNIDYHEKRVVHCKAHLKILAHALKDATERHEAKRIERLKAVIKDTRSSLRMNQKALKDA